MNCLTTFKERLGLFWLSKNDTKLVRSYLEVLVRGQVGNPRENQVGGMCIRNPTVSRACGERNYDFFRKKEWPDKARNVLHNV
jgi:predicted chitinase